MSLQIYQAFLATYLERASTPPACFFIDETLDYIILETTSKFAFLRFRFRFRFLSFCTIYKNYNLYSIYRRNYIN